MITLDLLRAKAETLARLLPDAALKAATADVMHPGAAGRRRAGSGEQFWQYRRYTQTDAADRIDWRRSARGREYFVRETELETARTVLVWLDQTGGFDWAGDKGRETKADRARAIMLANAILLSKAGERIGQLGSARGASLGKSASDRLAEELCRTVPDQKQSTEPLAPPRGEAVLIVASDFYDPIEEWRARLAPIAAKCKHGILLSVTDPVEHEFPFSGRTKFSRPGSTLDRLFGRAETVRDQYLEAFSNQRAGLLELASTMGWSLVEHRTDHAALEGAADLNVALQMIGAKT